MMVRSWPVTVGAGATGARCDGEMEGDMPSKETIMKLVLTLDSEFRGLTGREAFSYRSVPAPGIERWVFGDGTVKASALQASEYMAHLVALARTDPASLPYPFDQELAPGQDRRADVDWVRERIR